LQTAIKKLREENGRREFVFSFADGTTPGPSWTNFRFKRWMKRAGIELDGRKIVLLPALHPRPVGALGFQDFQDLLYSIDRMIREIWKHITSAIGKKTTR